MASKSKITTSSTAEYFSKNLQQVGFSSQTKAVLTTLKEAVDNALDACEDAEILPEISIEVEKIGAGSLKNSDQIRIRVEDNGPGIPAEEIPKVFGEYLASSKFGRGRCSRGQQGIGISAATTWAQLTSAQGALVISKTKDMRKAIKALVEVDIKHNQGVFKKKDTIDWDRPHGVSVEFVIDGRIQLNGEGGLLSYINGTTLVNPHLTLKYKLPVSGDAKPQWESIERVTTEVPSIPEATEPHPHTMKLGEFIAHSHLFGRVKVESWLKKGFSRVHEGTLKELKNNGLKPALLSKNVDQVSEAEFKDLFTVIQNTQLMAPSTKSVLAIGEDALSKAIRRLGEIDFFSVVTRKPTICDFKPVQIEVAVARLKERSGVDQESAAMVLRFANRVPLQFDKSGCAIVKAIETVNWRAYALAQPKDSIPLGPYVIAVSVVSPFIKFKNASKETIDASDELVAEMRLALIQAGQRLSRHIRREIRADALEEKLRHIEQFCPILVEGLCRITAAPDARKKRAEEGLVKLLGRDAQTAQKELDAADAIVIQAEQAKAEAKSKAEGKTKVEAKAETEPKTEAKTEDKAKSSKSASKGAVRK
jgi:DNA topoisomerase-6 subunit B